MTTAGAEGPDAWQLTVDRAAQAVAAMTALLAPYQCYNERETSLLSTRDIAASAQRVAKSSDGLRRRAAWCVGVVCATAGTLEDARAELSVIDPLDLQAAAHALLAELAEADGTAVSAG